MVELKEIFNKYKKILILGFGKEGKSTYRFIRKNLPDKKLVIADKNKNIISQNKILTTDKLLNFSLGENYLKNLDNYDLILKSPGIPVKNIKSIIGKVDSQTSIFLKHFHNITIGITGTKGKSTTCSLLYNILKTNKDQVVLAGNIGIPPFDAIEKIKQNTNIIFELSSHQLELINKSPYFSVILNLFDEHLDHFESTEEYFNSKLNITRFQNSNDLLVANNDGDALKSLLKKINPLSQTYKFSCKKIQKPGCYIYQGYYYFRRPNNEPEKLFKIINNNSLIGNHNLQNILAVICCAKLLNIPDNKIQDGIVNFKGLEHRLEYVGRYHNIDFYNDSIATVPEATIAAIESLKNVDTIILGGYDRGIDYTKFVNYLKHCKIRNMIFTGPAGKRMHELLRYNRIKNKNLFIPDQFEKIGSIIIKQSGKNSVCLLSPAAASYDQFSNFEERGNLFKKIARSL